MIHMGEGFDDVELSLEQIYVFVEELCLLLQKTEIQEGNPSTLL